MTGGIKDKVVVITGAGKGLGRAYALYLAAMGARVVVNNRRHPHETHSSADQTVAQIKANGGAAIAEYSSVENPDAGDNLLRVSLEAFGRLDAFVANAGISEACSFHKQELQDFRRVVEINLMGTVHTLQPAYRYMYEQKSGFMVVSSSVAGLYGEHGLAAYSASKAALLGLMYSLAQEGAARGLRINALAPFAVTQMTEKDVPSTLKDRLRPDYVAPLLAWLISDECKLNGETIICGGGRISRSRMMESKPLSFPDSPYDAEVQKHLWKKLQGLPLDRSSTGAVEQFTRFLAE